MDVRTNLARLRAQRGIGASELAAKVGISRQTIYAIESGAYVPNTIASLKLARVLETTVENLFQLESEGPVKDEIAEATILGDTDAIAPGQALRLCQVDNRLVAVVQELGGWSIPPADAILRNLIRNGKQSANASVQILGNRWKKFPRILLAGCDPGVTLLAQALQTQECELVVAFENSSRALDLLHEGLVHVAGTHLMDKATGKTDLLSITKMFGRTAVTVISYATWEEGLVTAKGNPKHIEGVADLPRKDIQFTNREPGAGCRRLLDDLLLEKGISGKYVNGYDRITVGHLQAAQLVYSREVDCCVSTRAVARALSLHFIPLAEKPYHLVIRSAQLSHPPIQLLLETLSRASFRREVEACTGYSMRTAGDRLYP